MNHDNRHDPEAPVRGIEIGRMHLHLPSGAAGIHGFVIGADAAPESGSVIKATLPVWAGGRITLFEGEHPMRNSTNPGPVHVVHREPRAFDNYGFDWAGRTTSDVAAEAAREGWDTITRRDAADLLRAQGYRIPPRREPDGRAHHHSGLWADQVDDLTWHVRESFDRFRFVYERCVFVCREAPVPAAGHAETARGA